MKFDPGNWETPGWGSGPSPSCSDYSCVPWPMVAGAGEREKDEVHGTTCVGVSHLVDWLLRQIKWESCQNRQVTQELETKGRSPVSTTYRSFPHCSTSHEIMHRPPRSESKPCEQSQQSWGCRTNQWWRDSCRQSWGVPWSCEEE